MLCCCFSGKKYQACCQPFHEGKDPENALLLMRSRYAAYTLDLPDYIMATTHPSSPHYSKNVALWKQQISKFSQDTSFENLEILDFKEDKAVAYVTFIAELSQNGQDVTFTEKSSFEKIRNRWLYKQGKLFQGRIKDLSLF